VVRVPKAYPYYDFTYKPRMSRPSAVLRGEAPNVHPVGRNGMHKYNNQDHSMYTAMLTVENMYGASTTSGRSTSKRSTTRRGRKSEGAESIRAGLLEAGPLAAAGVIANGANVIVTVAVARLLSVHSYGVLIQLTGLFLILSMPGSAVVVAVVRRVSLWEHGGSADQIRHWSGRLHRHGSMAVLIWALLVVAGRHQVAVLLGQRSGIGIAAILVAAAVFVLLSLDRGLLQARRSYRPLAMNLIVEGGVRTVAVLGLVALGKGPSGAAVGILVAELATAGHARYAAMRAWSAEPGHTPWLVRTWASGWAAALRRAPAMAGSVVERRRVVVDLAVASLSLSMIAVLQNVDVLVVGREDPSRSGAYASISVTSKAIVFGAIVLGGYLLPEAAIRWRQGGHALRQLGVVLLFLAVPAVALLAIAFTKPELFLSVVFHHHYLAASHALAPLVMAMCVLSVSVVLTMYLLAIGRRWVSGVLVVGAAALTGAVLAAHGVAKATATADLTVQVGLLLVIMIGFSIVHFRRRQSRTD
jgi:O-antigen/teichoic acid export membrane protein